MGRFHRSKPIMCGPHRLFNHRLKKSQLALNLTNGFLTDRSKPIVSRHDHLLKIHACSESSRRMIGSIELCFFFSISLCFTTSRSDTIVFLTDGVKARRTISQLHQLTDENGPSVRSHQMDRSCVHGIRVSCHNSSFYPGWDMRYCPITFALLIQAILVSEVR